MEYADAFVLFSVTVADCARTVGRSVVHHDHFVLSGRQVLIEGRSDTLADQPFEVVQRNYDADFFRHHIWSNSTDSAVLGKERYQNY